MYEHLDTSKVSLKVDAPVFRSFARGASLAQARASKELTE